MFLCASPHKHRVNVVLLISLRPPSPVCTRFKLICHVFVCFASQTPGLCSAFNFPSAPLPSLRTFYLSCFVCFASQTPDLCSALIALRLPYPVCTRFLLLCLCASPPKRRFSAVLPSLVPLPLTQVCSFYQCVSLQKQCSTIFLGIFLRLCDYWLFKTCIVDLQRRILWHFVFVFSRARNENCHRFKPNSNIRSAREIWWVASLQSWTGTHEWLWSVTFVMNRGLKKMSEMQAIFVCDAVVPSSCCFFNFKSTIPPGTRSSESSDRAKLNLS